MTDTQPVAEQPTLGIGALIANSVCPWLIQEVFTHDGVTDFRNLFLVPAFISIGAALLLAVAFHPPKQIEAENDD